MVQYTICTYKRIMNILLYFIYGKHTIYILIHSNKIYLCIRKYLPNKYFFHYSTFSPKAYYIVSSDKILAVVCLILFFLYSSSLHFICYNLLISLSLPSLKNFLPSLLCSSYDRVMLWCYWQSLNYETRKPGSLWYIAIQKLSFQIFSFY